MIEQAVPHSDAQAVVFALGVVQVVVQVAAAVLTLVARSKVADDVARTWLMVVVVGLVLMALRRLTALAGMKGLDLFVLVDTLILPLAISLAFCACAGWLVAFLSPPPPDDEPEGLPNGDSTP